MNNGRGYFTNSIAPSLFKTSCPLANFIRKGIVLMSLFLCEVDHACAQELFWNEKFVGSNVTAQFNINSTPGGSKAINQTVISVYSDIACGTLLSSSTLNQSKIFTFQSGQSYSRFIKRVSRIYMLFHRPRVEMAPLKALKFNREFREPIYLHHLSLVFL